MSTRTIETTAAEDDAIAYAYGQSQKVPVTPGMPVPAAETEAQYFERMTHNSTIGPMVYQQQQAKNAALLESFATIPPENRDAAEADLETVIVEHGGSVPLREASYLFSSSTAAPPRANSVEVNATLANAAQITKIFFDDLDAGNVSRMDGLLGLKLSTIIRLVDAAQAANFLQVVTTGAPIQRQGADGHVEIPVTFQAGGGTLADTVPLACSFSS